MEVKCNLLIVKDTCMTASLGPRWAVVGPFMANAMGGGGGGDGFRHMLEHLGPANREWLEDTRAHNFHWDLKALDRLTESVLQELDGKDVPALERERDERLVQVLKIRSSDTQSR